MKNIKTIGVYIAYWDSGERDRYENTLLSIKYAKEYINFLSKHDIDAEFKIFDFSEDQVFKDAIWIPYYKDSYKRSEKLNKIIDYCQEDIICIMDSDVVINPKDFNNLKDLMISSSDKRYYVSRLNDINDRTSLTLESLTVDFDNLRGSERVFEPDLGAFFFMNTEILKINKFDERFICYGGEDNELSYRIAMLGYKKMIIPIVFDHLPHNSLAQETQKTEQYKKQLELVIVRQKELQSYKQNS